MNNQVHTQIVSFIWSIADDCLRDVYVRGKYRDVILPMTVVFYIECKRYGRRNSVGVSIVRSLYGVQTSDQINKSILVTTGHVTRGARRFVEKQNTMMSILDVNEIHHLIQRSAMKYR